ncbi:helix-turn-helix domain-containing protein [Listeria booriae]|nr:helix-turn-helix transcriptional regulator [Listeria booriae]
MSVKMRAFAPNGLLTDNQNQMLKRWIEGEGENRKINQRELAQVIGISRGKMYNSFEKNPDRPFDEFNLKTVNKLIQLFNTDIQEPKKEKGKTPVKRDGKAKEKANQLIKKVEE